MAGWTLADVDTRLPGFTINERPDSLSCDVAGGRITYSRLDDMLDIALDDAATWDAAALSRFLDRTTRQADIAQPIYLEYCRRMVTRLLD